MYSIISFGYPKSTIALDAIDAAFNAMNAKTYSNNAKNIGRMLEGDYSQGFKDISQTDRAKNRRAMVKCRQIQNIEEQRQCIQTILPLKVSPK